MKKPQPCGLRLVWKFVSACSLNLSDVHETVRRSRYWLPIADRKGEKLAVRVRHLVFKDTWEPLEWQMNFT
jgi:hypothetical protein